MNGNCKAGKPQLPQTHARVNPPFHANPINSGSLGARTSPVGCLNATATVEKSALKLPAARYQSLRKDQYGLRLHDTPPASYTILPTRSSQRNPEAQTTIMSQAYEREQQNNSRLDELASKVSALRGVTIDIYDNARDQHVIDSTVCLSLPEPQTNHQRQDSQDI
jgi:hypothetical protein